MNIVSVEEEQIYQVPTSSYVIAPPHTVYFNL